MALLMPPFLAHARARAIRPRTRHRRCGGTSMPPRHAADQSRSTASRAYYVQGVVSVPPAIRTRRFVVSAMAFTSAAVRVTPSRRLRRGRCAEVG